MPAELHTISSCCGLTIGEATATPSVSTNHSSASLASQRHAVTKLGDLHAMVLREQLASPSVIVVGDVLQGLLALQQPIQQPHQTPSFWQAA